MTNPRTSKALVDASKITHFVWIDDAWVTKMIAHKISQNCFMLFCIVNKEDLKIDQRALFSILYLRFEVTGYLAQTANITHTHLNRHFTLRFVFVVVV